MSATIFLKHSMKRGTDAVINVSQHILIVFGLFTFIGFLNLFSGDTLANDILPTPGQSAEVSDLVMIEEALEAAAPGEGTISDILSPRMLGALDYVTRHYRVSQDALVPVFEIAQQIGQERQIDPLLIVAIIGIESGFKSDAKSAGGGHGLMQIIPRYHLNKIPDGLGVKGLMDPAVNVKVGTIILDDAISRAGSPAAGLQSYNGSKKKKVFASRVLAEKARMERPAL